MFANQAQSAAASAATADCRSLAPDGTGEAIAALTLDDRGMIFNCSRASGVLFKYNCSELLCRPVSLLLPQLADWDLIQNGLVNPRLRFLCHIGHYFQAVTQDGEHFASELFFNRLNSTGHGGLMLVVRPVIGGSRHEIVDRR